MICDFKGGGSFGEKEEKTAQGDSKSGNGDEGDKSDEAAELNGNEKDMKNNRNDTPRSNKSYDSKLRDQMMAELERVRKDMMSSASLIKKPAT